MTTLLLSDKRLTKTFTPTGVIPFDNAYVCTLETLDFTSFDEMVEVLTYLEGQPNAAVLRSEPITPGPGQRRLSRDQPDGSKATLRQVEAGLHWIMLDVDKLPAPAMDTMQQRVEFIRQSLPAPFQNATCFFQWSSSAGTKGWDDLSAHLWFWLNGPHTCSSLHRRTVHPEGDWRNLVDPAPFSPGQIHYTAAPVFDGVPDPLGDDRSMVIRGEVNVVALDTWSPPYRPRPVYTAKVHEALRPGERFQALLDDIGHPHFHQPILSSIAHYVATTSPDRRDRDWCLDQVEERCGLSGRSYINRAYLTRVYDQADSKFGARW